jgi:cysteine-rich repeat protein
MISGETLCDDGNLDDSDGCSSLCIIEDGWTCYAGSSEGPDTCEEVCGDGKNLGRVECDDGNLIEGDGCSNVCTIESGFKCSKNDELLDVCEEVCGDGITIIYNEGVCDDGNSDDGDGCSSTCAIEDGWNCAGGDSTQADTCVEICGDGLDF